MIIKKTLVMSSLFALVLCAIVNMRVAAHEIIHETEARARNLPDEIVQALRNGDAKIISKYFNSSVELIFSESRGVYGKSQAEQILRTFFANNSSGTGRFIYKHLHGSDRDNAQYYIGELHTARGLYRVTIYMKNRLIYRMSIESND